MRADRRGRRAARWLVIPVAAVLTGAASAGDPSDKAIHGTLDVRPDLRRHVEPGDRLVIKLFHPIGGVERDQKYRIVDSFELPLDFSVAPAIDMNGRTRHKAYVVEVFTDKDRDVLSVTAGELETRTPDTVPLGTRRLRLELDSLRR